MQPVLLSHQLPHSGGARVLRGILAQPGFHSGHRSMLAGRHVSQRQLRHRHQVGTQQPETNVFNVVVVLTLNRTLRPRQWTQ